MLRHLNQHEGGVKNYTNYLMDKLLSLDSKHEFVLIYNTDKNIGTYSHINNVREIAVNIKNRFLWDQSGVPWIHKKEKFDIIFNPKYSVPFNVECPTVFVCHGLNSYIMPWGSKWIDSHYRKYLYPRYAAKAASIISVSDTAKENLIDFLNVESEKIHRVYLGIHESYKKKPEEDEIKKIKSMYNLPERFFLYAGQIYPPKNFGRLLQAYSKVGPKAGIHLVVAGEHRWLCEAELKLIDKLDISVWVVKTGWVQHDILPAIYALAEALILPSLYEAFPSPILEAMSVGCPVVTSNRYGTKEIAGDDAVLVDPENVDGIARGLKKITDCKELKIELVNKGIKRAEEFSWDKCAEETMDVLEKTVRMPKNTTTSSSVKVFKIQEKHKHLLINPPTN